MIEYANKSKWKRVWNFRVRVCHATGETLRPFTRVWKGTYINYAGALFGAPPIELDCWIGNKQFLVEVIKGHIPS